MESTGLQMEWVLEKGILLLLPGRFLNCSLESTHFTKFYISIFLLIFACSYVDISTVDTGTSKLISGQIKATGAQFLEVKQMTMVRS